MRHLAARELQFPEVRLDPHPGEARRRGIHAQDRTQHLDVRARAPGVAIGARGRARTVRHLGEGSEADIEHAAPIAQLIQIAVSLAHFRQRHMLVVLEEERRLREARLVERPQRDRACLLACHHVGQYGQDVGVLRELDLARRIRIQLALVAPIELLRRGAQLRLAAAIGLRQSAEAEGIFQVRGPAVPHEQQQIEGGSRAIGLLRRVPAGPSRHPIQIAPPGQGSERAIFLLVGLEETQHGAHAGKHAAHRGRVVHIPPVIVHHADPPEREARDVLLQPRGVAAHGAAIALARIVDQFDGVAHEARVAGLEERDQALHARIAHVLQLLVVGAIHVGLVSAEPRCAPADVQNPIQLRLACVEFGLAHEGVAHRRGMQVGDFQRLVPRFHADLQIAVGAPPERAEGAARASIGDEFIVVADERFAFDIVAMALVPALKESFGVAQPHKRVFAAVHGQFRIRGGQPGLVQQQGRCGAGRDLNPLRSRREREGCGDARCAAEFLQALRALFHGRDGARHQHPPRMYVARLAPRRGSYRDGGGPSAIVEIRFGPLPRVFGRDHPVARPGREIAANVPGLHFERRVGFIAQALPLRAGVDDAFRHRVALQHEARAQRDLRFRREFAIVPHHGGEDVAPALQIAGDVHGLIAPVEEVAARRAPCHALPVDEELIAVVAAGMHHEAFGARIQVHGPAEMVDAGLRRRGARNCDPLRAPAVAQ